MKGISNIIAIILILLIAISLLALLYLWLTGFAVDLFNLGGNETQRVTQAIGSRFVIESVDNEVVFIRNTGQTKLTDFFVTVNDIPVAFTAPSELGVGLVGNITLNATLLGIKPSDNVVKITTAQGASATEKISGFTGYVIQSSIPVSSATVNIKLNGNIIKSTTTNSDGRYIVYISPGTYDLQASANYSKTILNQTISKGQIKTVNILLPSEAVDQSYDNYNPSSSVVCETYADRACAQQFTPTVSELTKVSLFGDTSPTTNYSDPVLAGYELVVRIETDANNRPSGILIDSNAEARKSFIDIAKDYKNGVSYHWTDITFSKALNINAGQKYWVVFKDNSSTNMCCYSNIPFYRSIGNLQAGYTAGLFLYSTDGSKTWFQFDPDLDLLFKTWYPL